jgi:hypothetical protein
MEQDPCKVTAEMRKQQQQEGLLVVGEYKRIKEAIRGKEYPLANY